MFVKICGITDAESLDAAVAAQVNAVGFVFAPSARRVSAEDAAMLCERLPAGVLRVAVMLHPSPSDWQRVRDVFAPDWLQTDAEDFDALALGGCQALPVYRSAPKSGEISTVAPMLFEGPTSGRGLAADWEEAAALARRARLILAGGLSPRNVEAAVQAVRPWGVDVSSGVERAPGRKDPDLIMEFVARARAAEEHCA